MPNQYFLSNANNLLYMIPHISLIQKLPVTTATVEGKFRKPSTSTCVNQGLVYVLSSSLGTRGGRAG